MNLMEWVWRRYRTKDNGISGLDHVIGQLGTDGKLLRRTGDDNFSNFSNARIEKKMTLGGRNLTKCATSRRKILTV